MLKIFSCFILCVVEKVCDCEAKVRVCTMYHKVLYTFMVSF